MVKFYLNTISAPNRRIFVPSLNETATLCVDKFYWGMVEVVQAENDEYCLIPVNDA